MHCKSINLHLFTGSIEMKDVQDDGKEVFEIHSPQQQTQMSHPVLHPGLSRPLQQAVVHQSNNQRQPPPNSMHSGKESRPSVIESSQPHIIECT